MKLPCLYIIAVATILCSISQSKAEDTHNLPPGAADLKIKLQKWEADKHEDLIAEIAEQRKKVAVALSRHLDKATKSGDLDGAIAIRKYISELNAADLKTPQNPEPETETTDEFASIKSERDFKKWLGTVKFAHAKWHAEVDTKEDLVYRISSDGTRSIWGKDVRIDLRSKTVTFRWTGKGNPDYHLQVNTVSEATWKLDKGPDQTLTISPRNQGGNKSE